MRCSFASEFVVHPKCGSVYIHKLFIIETGTYSYCRSVITSVPIVAPASVSCVALRFIPLSIHVLLLLFLHTYCCSCLFISLVFHQLSPVRFLLYICVTCQMCHPFYLLSSSLFLACSRYCCAPLLHLDSFLLFYFLVFSSMSS